MEIARSKKTSFIVLIIVGAALLCVGLFSFNHFSSEITSYQNSDVEARSVFEAYTPHPFLNSAAEAAPYQPSTYHGGALSYYKAPEGFTIISHSEAWGQDKLMLIYDELKLNRHGEEIKLLYEIVVFPKEEEYAAASYDLNTKEVSFYIRFPAIPNSFNVKFVWDIGKIHIYDGDKNTTIESIAASLSHEYGHLYTFYYMFQDERSRQASLDKSTYAVLRDAAKHGLITSSVPGTAYYQEHHLYLIEAAAEDYVQLLGSPTTRQVASFIDVRQSLSGSRNPSNGTWSRNAFPQENMMLPLANDVPGLEAYFLGFIDADPVAPIEEKKEVNLQISQRSVQHHLTTGIRSFVNYLITWNTPYPDAIYTLACYDPRDYKGFSIPIKTVRPGQTASATIGIVTADQGHQILTMEDAIARGKKVFFVIALLPDGTFYCSNKLEYSF